MLVGVTGGTGFLGAHCVAALVRAGHRVRLLVRDRARVSTAIGPFDVDSSAVQVHVGDVTDPEAVRGALRGTDAVLHAAAVYSFDSRAHATMRHTNPYGTETVLSVAHRLGADPIIHVSSVGALYPARTSEVDESSPAGEPRETYLASKAAAETIARGYQARGAPVVITYPPALLGPHDPRLGEQTVLLRNLLRGRMPVWPRGGFPLGDVRDTAHAHAALLDCAGGPARLFTPGRWVSTKDLVDAVRAVTGRQLPALFLRVPLLLPFGWLASALQRVLPWRLPVDYGGIYTCAFAVPARGAEAGARPLPDTIRDSVRWMHANGHLSAGQAGRCRVGERP
jgi:nucleoside-diphosphate-sugar epimerase